MSRETVPAGPIDTRTTDTPMEEAQPQPYWLRSSSKVEASHQESPTDSAPGMSRRPGVPIRPPYCSDHFSSTSTPLLPDSSHIRVQQTTPNLCTGNYSPTMVTEPVHNPHIPIHHTTSLSRTIYNILCSITFITFIPVCLQLHVHQHK